jgi:NAD+ synthase (glutamine-hydrolysing)
MDLANKYRGIVIGTGDLSEVALGWSTYNGDHMAMYSVNASIPKTLMRYIIREIAEKSNAELKNVLLDIIDTPVSPELLPSDSDGKIAQKTEDIIGPYELHDFFIYHFIKNGATPKKLEFLANQIFNGKFSYFRRPARMSSGHRSSS